MFRPPISQEVVRYAYFHGIRVVPEFNAPGRANSWGKGYPDIITKPRHDFGAVPVSPASNLTMQVLWGVYRDAAFAFSDNYCHLGGAGVEAAAWTDDPVVARWMEQAGLDTKGVFQYFVDHMAALSDSISPFRRHLWWQDVFDAGLEIPLDKQTLVQVWESSAKLKQVVQAGQVALMSAGWNLGRQGADASDTWIDFYLQDPTKGLEMDEAILVLGGEAIMWSDTFDESNLDSRAWPRAGAVFERLWSDEAVLDIEDATRRLNAHSCRMSRNGIGSGPLQPGFCLRRKTERAPSSPFVDELR